jgi:histidinol-phosphate phosphatase family protein
MIGHNNGPPLDEVVDKGGFLQLHAWRKAHREAWRPPSPEVAKMRARAAEALGIAYEEYTAILLDRGRSPDTFFFDLGGTLVRTRNNEIYADRNDEVVLMPGVQEKLSRLRDRAVFVVTNQPDIAEGRTDRRTIENYIDQVHTRCGNVIRDIFICDEPASATSKLRKPAPSMVLSLLSKHRLIPGQAVMVGDEVEDERCALSAGLARFFWAWRYFGAPPAPA